MESTGVPDKIQVSSETAKLLRDDEKSHWLVSREDQVVAKGLGQLTTYFVVQRRVAERRMSNASALSFSTLPATSNSDESRGSQDISEDFDGLPFWETEPIRKKKSKKEVEKSMRMVEWNVETLYQLLLRIVAQRVAKQEIASRRSRRSSNQSSGSLDYQVEVDIPSSDDSRLLVDQVVEVIAMPEFDATVALRATEASETLTLAPAVREELREFVTQIAVMYRDNPFHNFDHASHVTMSATKLLRRIVSPRTQTKPSTTTEAVNILEALHNSTYGISSDPMMQFTAVLATLVHDLDHTGLPNQELINMKTPAAIAYGNRSVAEQNSLDLAWDVLSASSEFTNLRQAIYTTVDERDRFRQILVNAVMATDIADKGLQQKRKERWNRAFSPKENPCNSRRATIVMDYILQASDVAHTMQHFLTYRKWNARLFAERYRAFLAGHDQDPADGWYEGEIGFFDYYIIPLAMKLKECGVFGVSHDEYLSFALANREEWEKRGRDIVNELVSREQSKRVPQIAMSGE